MGALMLLFWGISLQILEIFAVYLKQTKDRSIMLFMLISFIPESGHFLFLRIAGGRIGEGWGVEHCKNAGEGRRWRCQIINGTWEYLHPALYGGDIAIGDQLPL